MKGDSIALSRTSPRKTLNTHLLTFKPTLHPANSSLSHTRVLRAHQDLHRRSTVKQPVRLGRISSPSRLLPTDTVNTSHYFADTLTWRLLQSTTHNTSSPSLPLTPASSTNQDFEDSSQSSDPSVPVVSPHFTWSSQSSPHASTSLATSQGVSSKQNSHPRAQW